MAPVLRGNMQNWPLTVNKILDYAAKWHSEQEIVSKTVEGPITVTTYAQLHQRAQLCSLALQAMGVREGSMVATLAWNSVRHMEVWYGIMGLGGIVHTLNPRLSDKDLKYIANDAKDTLLLADITFTAQIARILPHIPSIQGVIFMTDRQNMPLDHGINVPVYCYEELLGAQAPVLASLAGQGGFQWTQVDENAACGLCYTSLHGLMENFRVTVSLGVPTVWLALLNYMDANKLKFSTFKMAVIGGAAPPKSMIQAFQERYGVEVRHLWGMTELCPLGTLGGLKAPVLSRSAEEQLAVRAKQGRAHVLCEMRIVDDEGKMLPHDGRTVGHLQVRGPHVVEQYLNLGKLAVDKDGWFATGDVASIDRLGHMAIADRSKDVIKSGGEWISSIEIENLAMSDPHVAEAAVVAIPDTRWGERPLLVVVLKPGLTGEEATHDSVKEALYKLMDSQLAKFAVPDDVVFVDEIPHNATGKVSKLTLREMFKEHKPAKSRL